MSGEIGMGDSDDDESNQRSDKYLDRGFEGPNKQKNKQA